MSLALTIVLWGSVGLIAYVFAGYPAMVAVRAALRPRPWRREASEPTVSIVVAAYNESAAVLPKIANLLALDYPADRVEILVGSDGSTDGTADQLLELKHPRVRTFAFAKRRGKPSVLNALVAEARGEIIVFADVRQTFDTQALRKLIQSFADSGVGAVTGELIVTAGASGFYWKYEKFVRSRESIAGSTVVVTGAIYAIRKALFEPIAADTICDDLLIPLRIARRGYRVVVEREALAYDPAQPNASAELSRKTRTIAGAFQVFAREPWLFNPLRNPVWWQTMSHKAMRLVVAPLQALALAANVALAAQSAFYQWMLLAQILFYAGAIAGCILPRDAKRPIFVTVPYTFCLLSWATVVAFQRWITRRQAVTWEKAPSPQPMSSTT